MEPVKGIKLNTFLLKKLRRIADLIYFDGPLLSHFKNEDGDSYLYYWCDVDENYNRWLIFRVAEEELKQYLLGKISLREIILDPVDGFVYSADIDNDLQYHNVYIIQPADLPETYFPEIDSFYEFEPVYSERENIRRRQDRYRISLDKDWSLRDLSEFPRVYSQIYSFIYSFQAPLANQFDIEALQDAYTSYPWQGGYSTVGFFNSISAFVHSEHKPEISSIQYSSPGWIDLNLYNPTAFSIEAVILSFVKSKGELKSLYRDIYKELRKRRLIKFNIKSKEARLNEENIKFIKDSTSRLTELMSFEYLDQMNELADNPLTILKVLLSFYRRVEKLAQYQLEGKASFYG